MDGPHLTVAPLVTAASMDTTPISTGHHTGSKQLGGQSLPILPKEEPQFVIVRARRRHRLSIHRTAEWVPIPASCNVRHHLRQAVMSPVYHRYHCTGDRPVSYGPVQPQCNHIQGGAAAGLGDRSRVWNKSNLDGQLCRQHCVFNPLSPCHVNLISIIGTRGRQQGVRNFTPFTSPTVTPDSPTTTLVVSHHKSLACASPTTCVLPLISFQKPNEWGVSRGRPNKLWRVPIILFFVFFLLGRPLCILYPLDLEDRSLSFIIIIGPYICVYVEIVHIKWLCFAWSFGGCTFNEGT